MSANGTVVTLLFARSISAGTSGAGSASVTFLRFACKTLYLMLLRQTARLLFHLQEKLFIVVTYRHPHSITSAEIIYHYTGRSHDLHGKAKLVENPT